jgi:hypothetical protein
MHEGNHEVAKVVACSFAIKTERKKKLLQTFDKVGIPLAPTPFESIGLVECTTVGQWSWQPPLGWLQQLWMQPPRVMAQQGPCMQTPPNVIAQYMGTSKGPPM